MGDRERQEIPPDICPECFRSLSGEHGPDCGYLRNKEAVDQSIHQAEKNIHLQSDTADSTQACLQEAMEKLGITSIASLDEKQRGELFDLTTRIIKEKVGECVLENQHLLAELEQTRNQLVRGSFDAVEKLKEETADREWKTDDLKIIDTYNGLRERIKQLVDSVNQHDELLGSWDIVRYKETFQKSKTEIDLLKEDIENFIRQFKNN